MNGRGTGSARHRINYFAAALAKLNKADPFFKNRRAF